MTNPSEQCATPLPGTGPPAVRMVTSGTHGHRIYHVTGYEAARQALTDPRLSKDTAAFFAGKNSKRNLHPAVSQNMLATDPPEHTRLRRLVTSAFTTGAVAKLQPSIDDLVSTLLDQWPADGTVDLIAELAMPLPVMVICELLGVPEADRGDLRRWSGDLFAVGRPDVIDAASHALADAMTELIRTKRDTPGDTLLDGLIAARDGDDRLTEDELLSLAVLLFVAGHETTTNLIGSAVLTLLEQPARYAELRDDPDKVDGVLDELLRHSSPVAAATFRYAREPLTLGGVDIEAGAPVYVVLAEANRDPSRFPAPDDLDLTRPASGHLAFGHGIHRCVGAPLARAEAASALRALLRRFPHLRLAVAPEDVTWRPTRLVRGPASLPVTP